jgi:dienelactone hydrolase
MSRGFLRFFRVPGSVCWLLASLFVPRATVAADAKLFPALPGDRMLARYFEEQTSTLAERCLTEVRSAEDWARLQPGYRHQLFQMLGLDENWPHDDLHPVVTGRIERDDFVVEKLHFQSRPGLYVTANLYLPRGITQPAPAILYLSGHGPVITNGVSYGNKVAYQHHGIWFARNGYACLILDTLQLGEIEGLHHGTYREGMWWWNSRGYTPAGVEAWNAIRALDYLQTRTEVDAQRIGVTGRSGGGAYSWWVAALDDRVRAAAPVAGITDLRNHVVDGAVEGHCDCMFMVNTYRWDYPQVAALVAPRPLLIVNTDADSIFPLDGVVRSHGRVRRIYQLLHVPNQLGLTIGPGPHKDTQDLQVPVLRWFNRQLRDADPVITNAAVKLFGPPELKVFTDLPADALNTNMHALFVARAPAPPEKVDASSWAAQREAWRSELREKCFGAWPDAKAPLEAERIWSAVNEGVRLEAWEFNSQPAVRLRIYVVGPAVAAGRAAPRSGTLQLLGDDRTTAPASFSHWLAMWPPAFAATLRDELAATRALPPMNPEAFHALRREILDGGGRMAWLAPRGFGLTRWSGEVRTETQIRRRFMLLGQTLEAMRVHDVCRAVGALRSLPDWREVPLTVSASDDLACDALYAALFEPAVHQLRLHRLSPSHEGGPDYLNVLRVLDVPEVVAMVAERTPIRLAETAPSASAYARRVAAQLGWNSGCVTSETGAR